MNYSLQMRLGAVLLALVTLAAIVFAILNFQQRSLFAMPDDGVAWMDGGQGVVALHVVAGSPAAKAGIQPGDRLESIRGATITKATDVQRELWRVGPWAEVQYKIERNGEALKVPLITAPEQNPSSIENYLRLTALLYLFIGLFIFVRRWTAPRAAHFYVFCLVSFVLYSFHYTGKLNSFDWTVYWANSVALLLQPALLALQIFVATATLDFVPSISSRDFLDTLDLLYMAAYFFGAAAIFLSSYL